MSSCEDGTYGKTYCVDSIELTRKRGVRRYTSRCCLSNCVFYADISSDESVSEDSLDLTRIRLRNREASPDNRLIEKKVAIPSPGKAGIVRVSAKDISAGTIATPHLDALLNRVSIGNEAA